MKSGVGYMNGYGKIDRDIEKINEEMGIECIKYLEEIYFYKGSYQTESDKWGMIICQKETKDKTNHYTSIEYYCRNNKCPRPSAIDVGTLNGYDDPKSLEKLVLYLYKTNDGTQEIKDKIKKILIY